MEKLTQSEIDVLMDELVLPFYGVKRDMTIPPENARDENDAEHSWSLTVVACSLAEHIDPSLNVALVAQFCSVHDLPELGAGDTSVWADDDALNDKAARETEALETIKEKFSKFPWLVQTLEAYERMDTNEAKYVRAIDKYLALCMRIRDGGKFYHNNHITKEMFDRNLASHRQKAHLHPGVAEYYEKIRAEYDAHPEYFFQI